MPFDRDLDETRAQFAAMYSEWLDTNVDTPSELNDLSISPDGTAAIGIAVSMQFLEGRPETGRVIRIDIPTGEIFALTTEHGIYKSPRWSADGASLAYLEATADGTSLIVHSVHDGAATGSIRIDGAERLEWSPCSKKILCIVAEPGADEAGVSGGRFSKPTTIHYNAWQPTVSCSVEKQANRTVRIFDLELNDSVAFPGSAHCVWEASWCGSDCIATIASLGRGEENWYHSSVFLADLNQQTFKSAYSPQKQLGGLKASPDGQLIGFLEGRMSDRGVTSGNLILVDASTSSIRPMDIEELDVNSFEFSSNKTVLAVGQVREQSTIYSLDLELNSHSLIWSDDTFVVSGTPHGQLPHGVKDEAPVFMRESWFAPPTLIQLTGERIETILALGSPPRNRTVSQSGEAEKVTWESLDSLEIDGWLLTPNAVERPFPLVVEVHGGPVSQSHPRFLARTPFFRSLIQSGIAVFFPNPRGSSGRGQNFSEAVVGDMGGRDADDILSGIDYLIQRELVDPDRVAITGGSYGGFMACLLVSQHDRFKTAVAISPVTNWFSERMTSNLSTFCDLFLADDMTRPGSAFQTRSPLMHAHKVNSPCLICVGALDGSTPPGQGVEFYNAVRLSGGACELINYPLEGHRPRSFPALIDYNARATEWIKHYLLESDGKND